MTPGYYVSQLKIYSRSVENDNPAQRGTNQMLKIAGGAMPVEVSGDSPQPKPIYQAGGDQPAVNPSSGIYPLDVSAAFSDDRKTLTFAVLNPSDSKHCMKLAVNGAKLASHGRL
jgi:alpha-N-arabinofuranosidase